MEGTFSSGLTDADAAINTHHRLLDTPRHCMHHSRSTARGNRPSIYYFSLCKGRCWPFSVRNRLHRGTTDVSPIEDTRSDETLSMHACVIFTSLPPRTDRYERKARRGSNLDRLIGRLPRFTFLLTPLIATGRCNQHHPSTHAFPLPRIEIAICHKRSGYTETREP